MGKYKAETTGCKVFLENTYNLYSHKGEATVVRGGDWSGVGWGRRNSGVRQCQTVPGLDPALPFTRCMFLDK